MTAEAQDVRRYPSGEMAALTVEMGFAEARELAMDLLEALDGERVVVKPATMIQFRGEDVMVTGAPETGRVWTVGVVNGDGVMDGGRVFGLRGYGVRDWDGEGVPEWVWDGESWRIEVRVQ